MIKRTLATVSVLATFAFYGVAAAHADKVLLCHVTGSESNPFVLVNVSTNALGAHLGHGDFTPQEATVESCLLGPGGDPGPLPN